MFNNDTGNTACPTLTGDEVATLLRFKRPATFRNKRATLERAGFPRRLPGLNLYSRDAVLAWISANGSSEPAPKASASIDLAARSLEQAYS